MLKTIIKLPFKLAFLPFKIVRPKYIVYLTGLYTVGYFFYDMSYSAFTHHLREPLNLRQRYGPETFAVITGATNPTGKAFSEYLVKHGFNLVLVDQDEDALNNLNKQI